MFFKVLLKADWAFMLFSKKRSCAFIGLKKSVKPKVKLSVV